MRITEAKALLKVQKMFRISEEEEREIDEIVKFLNDNKTPSRVEKPNRIYHITSPLQDYNTVEDILFNLANEAVLDAQFLDETIHRLNSFKDEFIYHYLLNKTENTSSKIKTLTTAYIKCELKQNQLDEKSLIRNYCAALRSNANLKNALNSSMIERLSIKQEDVKYLQECVKYTDTKIAKFKSYIAPKKHAQSLSAQVNSQVLAK